jgi:hypothetical protein
VRRQLIERPVFSGDDPSRDARRLGMAPNDKTVKIVLDERDIPTHWYNVVPDLPEPPSPPLHPGTGQRLGPSDLAPLFPMGIIMQEVSAEPRIEIPDEVRPIYRLWRPSPVYRARCLEQALDTPVHIYDKYEGVSPAGSHKPITVVAQAYSNKQEGTERLATETGAGQWGTALALACSTFNLECTVYMVKANACVGNNLPETRRQRRTSADRRRVRDRSTTGPHTGGSTSHTSRSCVPWDKNH